MSSLFGTFGALAFLMLLTIIFLLGREFLKLKKENTHLKSENEALLNLIPTLSSEELETLKENFIIGGIEPCQKS